MDLHLSSDSDRDHLEHGDPDGTTAFSQKRDWFVHLPERIVASPVAFDNFSGGFVVHTPSTETLSKEYRMVRAYVTSAPCDGSTLTAPERAALGHTQINAMPSSLYTNAKPWLSRFNLVAVVLN